MTPRGFCASGEAETLKGAIHATTAALVGVMALYNSVAWCFRRQRHLAINATLYGALTAFEIKQSHRHFSKHARSHL